LAGFACSQLLVGFSSLAPALGGRHVSTGTLLANGHLGAKQNVREQR
jgi:hypothetical protein